MIWCLLFEILIDGTCASVVNPLLASGNNLLHSAIIQEQRYQIYEFLKAGFSKKTLCLQNLIHPYPYWFHVNSKVRNMSELLEVGKWPALVYKKAAKTDRI